MRRVIRVLFGVFVALHMAMTAAAQPVNVWVPNMMVKFSDNVNIPILVENLEGATSVEITLRYDYRVFDWNGYSGGGDVGGGSFERSITPNGNTLKIKLESDAEVSGSGSLIELGFWVWCDIDQSVTIELLDVTINGAQVDPGNLSNGIFDVGLSLSGKVNYYMGNRPIKGAMLELIGGTQPLSGTTTEHGTFSLIVPRGNYQINVTKAGELSGITAYDASLIMHAARGGLSLSDDQQLAADINDDGRVDENDAQLLLDVLTGSEPGPSGQGWVFLPQRNNFPVNNHVSNLDVTGILIGDVSGNWGKDDAQDNVPRLSVSHVSGEIGQPTVIPINVDTRGKDLYAAELLIQYDPSRLQVTSAHPGDLPEGSRFSFNTDIPGEVRIALASDSPLRGAGHLVELQAQHLGHSEEVIVLELTEARFNESIATNLGNGSVSTLPHASITLDHDRIASATLVKGAAQVIWGDPYVSRSDGGETGVYLGFPDLIGHDPNQISPDTRIVSAMLLWKFDAGEDEAGLPDKHMGLLLRRVADPDELGAPAVTNRSGQKTGLSYVRRDDRIGSEIPWTSGGDGIEAALVSEDEVYTWLNPAVVDERWVVTELKEIVQGWIDGSSVNQGVYIQADEGWEPGDRLGLKDLRLVVYYANETPAQLGQVELDSIETKGGKAKLSWNPSSATNVRVIKSEGIAPVGPYDPNGALFGTFTQPEFEDYDVEDGELYYYGLMATDSNNNYGPIVVQPVVPGTVQPPQLNVSAGDASANLSWTTVGEAEGYVVYRRGPEDRRFIRQHRDVLIDTLWTDRSVAPGNTYEYYVVSVNSNGEGPGSAIHSVEIDGEQDPPNAPSNLQGTALSPYSIRLTWDDNSDNELVFVARRWGEGEWRLVGSVPANTTELVVRGLAPNTTYEINVWAKNDRAETPAGSIYVSTPDGLPIPADVQWQQISPGSIEVSWQAPSDTGVTDVVVVLYDSDGAEIESLSLAPSIDTVRFYRLEAGSEYRVEVFFKNSSGDETSTRIEHVVTTDYLFRGPGM